MILCLHCSNISFSKAGTSVLIIGFISQVPSTVPAHQRCSVFVKWVSKWGYESLSKHLTVVKVVINYYTWLNSIIKCILFSFNIIHAGFSVFSTDFFMKSQELVKKQKQKRKVKPSHSSFQFWYSACANQKRSFSAECCFNVIYCYLIYFYTI